MSGINPSPGAALARSTLTVLLVVALLGLTLWILRPFLGAMVWATMIVVATWPVMTRIQQMIGGRRPLAVAAMVGMLLFVIALPLALAVGTIVANAGAVVERAGELRSMRIPPPPEWLAGLPVIGPKAVETWLAIAASPVAEVMATARPYATTTVLWVAGTMQGIGWLLIQFLLTLAVAAFMYAKGEEISGTLLRAGRLLAGEAGDRVVRLSAQAIRGVALGVIVTAIMQAALAGVGLAVAGVPFAWLLAAVAFVLCIAQLGPVLVLLAAVGWLYWAGAAAAATGLLAWTAVVGTLDNVVRPYLMSKGTDLPMLVMFVGVIGGMLSFGLIGLFVGPVILAVAYTLLGAWIGDAPDAE